jgi:hypothetical protein
MFGTLRKEHEIRQKNRRQSDLHEPLVGSAPTSEESEGAVTETTADEGGSEGSEGEILSGADHKARRKGGSQSARGNPLVFNEAKHSGESSGQESDGSSVYDGVPDKGGVLADEQSLLVPINHHLHDIRSDRIKRKSDYSLKVAVCLHKAYESYVKNGKVPTRQITALIVAWSKEPANKALSPKQQRLKDAFKAEKEFDEDYEDAAWQYFGNGHDDGRSHENIYLMKFSKRTLRQVFNMLRSKLVYESRLQKTDGKLTSWHSKVRSFHDGTVDVEALLEFARVHTDLPLGDEGVTRKDQYPNELLPTHRGMTKLDWSCRVWTDIRKMKFDEKGRLNGKRAARKRGKRKSKKVTIVVKPTKTNGSGAESSGSLDLNQSVAEGVSGVSDGDARL